MLRKKSLCHIETEGPLKVDCYIQNIPIRLLLKIRFRKSSTDGNPFKDRGQIHILNIFFQWLFMEKGIPLKVDFSNAVL